MSAEEPALPESTRDDTDVGWGDESDDTDERLREEVPPHHVDRD